MPTELEDRLGRQYLWRSLRTTNRREAIIKARQLSAIADEVFEMSHADQTLPADEINRILREYISKAMERWAVHAAGGGWKSVQVRDAQIEALGLSWGDLADGLRFHDDTSGVKHLADDLIKEHGLHIQEGTEAYRSFSRRVVDAELELLKLKKSRLEEHYGSLMPEAGPGRSTSAAHGPIDAGPSLSEVLPKYIDEMSREAWTRKTAHQTEQTFRLFREHLGDKAVTEITRRDVALFRDALAQLPKNYGKSPKDREKKLSELIKQEGPRIQPKTVKRHLTALTGFFSWTKREGHTTGESPASGFKFARSKRAREERPAWTQDELQSLFRSPLWAGCKSAHRRTLPGSMIIRDSLYWVPLVLLFSGLRLEEAAQLRIEDVKQDAEISYFDIRTGDGRQLKTAAAVRKVPVHSALISAGLLEHIDEHRAKGADRIFPDLAPGGPDGRYGFYLSKKFGRYRRGVGLDRDHVDLHALRANFTTALMNAEVAESTANELLGHSGSTISYDRYGKGVDLPVLQRAVEKVKYPGVCDVSACGTN